MWWSLQNADKRNEGVNKLRCKPCSCTEATIKWSVLCKLLYMAVIPTKFQQDISQTPTVLENLYGKAKEQRWAKPCWKTKVNWEGIRLLCSYTDQCCAALCEGVDTQNKLRNKPGLLNQAAIIALERQKQEDCYKVEASLAYGVRVCLRNPKSTSQPDTRNKPI